MSQGARGARLGRQLSERVLAVPSGVTGPERRRTRTLLWVSSLLALLVIPVIVLITIAVPDDDNTVPLAFLGWLVYGGIRWCVARRHLTAAAWVFVAYFVVVPLNWIPSGEPANPIDLMFVAVLPIMAAVVLPTRHVLIACGIAFIELAALTLVAEAIDLSVGEYATYVVILLGIISSAAVVLTVIIDRAFDEADRTRVEAERLADELQVANADLEQRVRSRTTELADALQREQRLSAQLGELSVRDSLTGLHNRRHMDETIDQMFKYAVRSGNPLSVAVIDLDDFKPINDRHTHLVGDQVLRQAALVLAHSIRGSDELVRMGGEEFALLMPGTRSDEAVTVCERMRCALEEFDWATIVPGIVVTASFGVSTTGTFREVTDLLRAADEQLFKAKRAGKNRVLCVSAEVA